MSTIKLRANQLSNLIEQITADADALAETLKSGCIPTSTAEKLDEVLAHSLILVSVIADTLLVGDPSAIKEMGRIAKDFHSNLKDINQSIQSHAVY